MPVQGRGSAVGRWAPGRLLYLDNLKVVLIAAIIAGHGVLGYATLGFWPYAEMREVTLSPVIEIVLVALVIPFALFMVPLLFLVAGLLTPASLGRKGTRAYVRDRLLRLGVPFAVFVLLVWPLVMYPVHPPGEHPRSYWTEFLRHGSLDTGPLWFVGALLVFSLAYAGWVRARRNHAGRPWRDAITARHLLGLAAAVTIATFLVRLVLPYNSDNKLVDVNLYQWPECAALFALGIAAARQGWLTAVPGRLRRQCRAATLAAVGGFAVFVGFGAAQGGIGDMVWGGGWHFDALVFAAGESTLTVFGPVWLLAVAQRHLGRRSRWAGPAVSRSAYGAFLLQGPVLIGLAMALRFAPLPAEVKALIVACGGIAGSFALAWLLIRRAPGVARIL